MDTARGFDNDRIDTDQLGDEHHSDAGEPHVDIGTDERRMHVRAYNHWVTLLDGRAYPSIEDLDPDNIADFGPNSVLLDFTAGIETPHIQFLGRALREECALDSSITNIADVPSRSLLSRLTDHYLQIIANRAPIGFEAEFVGIRGNNTMYRGILMPFSSDEDTIDFIYGVINWKELVDAETQARLDAELAEARRTAPKPVQSSPKSRRHIPQKGLMHGPRCHSSAMSIGPWTKLHPLSRTCSTPGSPTGRAAGPGQRRRGAPCRAPHPGNCCSPGGA